MEEYISNSAAETERIGQNFAEKLKAKDVVFLKGNLGSGKTIFVKGLARGLGVKSRVISPTFVIARSYNAKKKGIRNLYHLDLYRLKNENEVQSIDLNEFIDDETGVVAIEWPNIGQGLVKGRVWTIDFSEINEGRHKINIEYG